MKDLQFVDQSSISINLSTHKIGFNLKPDAEFDEQATLAAVNEAFPGAKIIRKPDVSADPSSKDKSNSEAKSDSEKDTDPEDPKKE